MIFNDCERHSMIVVIFTGAFYNLFIVGSIIVTFFLQDQLYTMRFFAN